MHCRLWLHLQGWLLKAVPVMVGVRGCVHLSIWCLLLPGIGGPLLVGVLLTKQALWGLNMEVREIVGTHGETQMTCCSELKGGLVWTVVPRGNTHNKKERWQLDFVSLTILFAFFTCYLFTCDTLYTNQMERMKNRHFILSVKSEEPKVHRTDKSRKETEEDDWLQGLNTGCCPVLYLIKWTGYTQTHWWFCVRESFCVYAMLYNNTNSTHMPKHAVE